MSPVRRLRPVCFAVCLALVCLASIPSLAADKPSDAQVKAAYVYNFAKFVEWPANKFAAATSPLRFCILNDFSFEANLTRIVHGKSIAGHPLEVVQVRDAAESLHCHILF